VNPYRQLCTLTYLRDSSCTTAETIVAVFLCKGSNLRSDQGQLQERKPECNGFKTMLDAVSIRGNSLQRRIFQAALRAVSGSA